MLRAYQYLAELPQVILFQTVELFKNIKICYLTLSRLKDTFKVSMLTPIKATRAGIKRFRIGQRQSLSNANFENIFNSK